MLKNIPKNLSPELVKTLMEMGHGDELVIADGNFPAHRLGQRVIRLDGQGGVDVLRSILELFPLDIEYSDQQVFLMEVANGDSYDPVIWKAYENVLKETQEGAYTIGYIERFAFYERAKDAFCVIETSEEALYANIILKKGVVR
ncbi:MAG: RbsD/FucU domain-containing protein [Peptoniphilaceae bacterium]|nr:RbsD/FucU domain-containing protein [Peptoniphilaceae bacterium]MDY3076452.1 RbsD/FucU domain-containing protein [Peptoniphilaceae bacterium]MDY4196690.1 RbsD/FucU domain-containing protein [Peptoniphilaceae bacterium]MDY5842745.1 RbsD/FucU domain-containing protein [Peptoniphilaceae bacterium]